MFRSSEQYMLSTNVQHVCAATAVIEGPLLNTHATQHAYIVLCAAGTEAYCSHKNPSRTNVWPLSWLLSLITPSMLLPACTKQ
jgi:hypothetical protein